MTTTYQGYAIVLTESMMFSVDLDGDTKVYESYNQATAAIDAYIARSKAVAKETLALAAVNRQGKLVLITGIHAGHGNVTRKPPAEKYDSEPLYPDTLALRLFLKRVVALERQLHSLEQVLQSLVLPSKIQLHYGPPVDLLGDYAKLKAVYAEKFKAATGLQEPVAKEEQDASPSNPPPA